MNKQQTLDQVRDMGVVGAGGAGFPTYRKLDASVEWIIANGAECEPLLSKDRETMLQASDVMIQGLLLMQELTGASRVTVAVKEKNRDLLETLGPALSRHRFDTHVMKDVYPAGDEYVLVHDVAGRRIPPGGLPLQVGCLVNNVETIVNVAHAAEGRPVIDKWVTICGAVENPITTVVPVGTSFRDCIALAGGATTDEPVVLTGGLMMGGLETDLDLPVTKTIGGVLPFPKDHYLVHRKSATKETYTRIGHGQCDQCSLCTELCPRYLLGYPIEPHRVMRTLLMSGTAKEAGSLWSQYCCECNICSMVACPEGLDPMKICVDAKAVLRDKGLSRTDGELERLFRPVHPVRQGRQVPITRLYQRLGLTAYDRKAPYVENRLLPKRVRLPLDTHIGQPASPQVRVGDQVRRGDLLADVPRDQLGCPVHASIDGQVSDVTDKQIELTA